MCGHDGDTWDVGVGAFAGYSGAMNEKRDLSSVFGVGASVQRSCVV